MEANGALSAAFDQTTQALKVTGGAPLSGPFGFTFTNDPALFVNYTAIGVANRTVYMRVKYAVTMTLIRYHVGNAAGNICLSAYSNSGAGLSAVPGARLATTGLFACPAAGPHDAAVAASLAAGDWLSIGGDDATASFASAGALVAATNLAAGRTMYQDSAFPSPATPAAAPAAFGGIILVGA